MIKDILKMKAMMVSFLVLIIGTAMKYVGKYVRSYIAENDIGTKAQMAAAGGEWAWWDQHRAKLDLLDSIVSIGHFLLYAGLALLVFSMFYYIYKAIIKDKE